LEDAENPDSVAAYMEQLLARSRQGSASAGYSPAKKPVEPPKQPSVTYNTRAEVDEKPAFDEQASTMAEPEAPVPAPRPRRPHDKDALRANLDSMRHVANMSARSALEKHARKRVRGMVAVKSLLAISSFAIGLAIFAAPVLGLRSSPATGWSAIVVGAIVLADMFRATLTEWWRMLTRRWSKKNSASRDSAQNDAAASDAEPEEAAEMSSPANE
jgi:hypothetical protein